MKTRVIHETNYKLLYSRAQIQKRVYELARKIAYDYRNVLEPPILMFVLTGGLFLGVDLCRVFERIGFKYSVDTVGLTRFRKNEVGRKKVTIISEPHADLGNRDIIVVEDCVDYGKTMNFLHNYLLKWKAKPKSINYCTLILKKSHDPLIFDIKYLGFTMGPQWIVGYGMDSNQEYRGLPDIYIKVQQPS